MCNSLHFMNIFLHGRLRWSIDLLLSAGICAGLEDGPEYPLDSKQDPYGKNGQEITG